MLGKPMFREQRVPVGEDLRLARVVRAPVGIELGGEAVPVAADVRATTLGSECQQVKWGWEGMIGVEG